MKNFLSKNWKRILIIIGIVLIVLNIVNKFIAPRMLVTEFAKYGPNVAPSRIGAGASNIIDKVNGSAQSAIPNNIMRYAIIFAVALLVVAIISDLAEKKSAPPKKK